MLMVQGRTSEVIWYCFYDCFFGKHLEFTVLRCMRSIMRDILEGRGHGFQSVSGLGLDRNLTESLS